MLRFIKISLLTLVLAISFVGSPMGSLRTVWAECPVGDLSGDCQVNLPDLLLFAAQWLDTDTSGEGLAAHWKLDGNANDPIGGNHGTIHGNPAWTVGQLDGALYFDGDGDYVDCGNDSSLNLTNNFSISAWFNSDDADPVLLICKGNVPAYESGGAYTLLCVPSNGILAFYVRDSGNTNFGYAVTAVSLSQWTHVVGTFGDGNINIYKNGVFVANGVLGTTTIHSNNGPLGIGAEGDGGMPFSGTIDDVRIYDQLLSEVEVLDVMNFGMPDPNSADLDDDGNVSLFDYTVLADRWQEQGNPLVINEFMASNSSSYADPQGQYDDWIEIYNTGSVAIDIGGMYLTDDLDEPMMWRIPDDSPGETTIGPYGHLLIWADKDSEDGPLHVEFKLDGVGEEIGLFDTDGNTLVDSIIFDEQVADISYGRYPDASDTLRFMGFPTPGAQNNAGYLGQVADTEFSHNRGFYVEDFNVTITTDTPGATIRYTTNGSAPTGTQGNVYVIAIPIVKTTYLRAAAFKPGYLPSNSDTQTYIFLDEVVQQSNNPIGFPSSWGSTSADYEMDPEIVSVHSGTIKDDLKSIPTMSLVMSMDALFNPSTDSSIGGIYANEWEEGVAWERPGSIEFFYPDSSEGFQVNCGVRIYGGVGRREKKKTLRLLFKGIYGPSKLRYPLFGPDATDRFDTIILRANFNDGYPWDAAGDRAQYIRDEYVRKIQLALGHPSPHGTFVHLYINGLYWGLYNPVERPEASFAATYFGGDKEDWDALNSGNPTGESSTNTWYEMLNLVRQGVTTNEAYQRLQGNSPDGTPDPNYVDYLDIDNYIGYMLINFFVGNRDWPGHNWYAAMNRVDSTGFKSFSWDAEWVMGLNSGLNENRTGVSNSICEPYAYLRNNTEFCMLFADHAHWAFLNGGPLYVDPAYPQWDPLYPERNRPAAPYAEMADFVERAMIAESARWGDVHSSTPYNIDQWRSERDWVLNTYMPDRSDIVLDQLRSAGLYPNVGAPVFYINGSYQHGGQVSSGDLLSITAPTGMTYYTIDGNDPRRPAVDPAPGTSTTLVAENAVKRVLVPIADIGDTWRNGQPFDDTQWNHGLPIIPGRTGGVGYERSSGYDSYITYDVETEMYSQTGTCYIRIPFTFNGNLGDFNFMTLKIRYDDGFIAYLNDDPNELTRRNFTGAPAWNSAASGQHDDSAAVNFENIDVSDHLSYLRQGDNILAIHGLNVSTTSTDFLISVELVAGEADPGGALSPSAIKYNTPLTLTESTRIRTRVLDNITWSALNEATFAVGPVADNLRITEMMYHPLDTGDPNNDPNAEFIELKNIGTETLNLNLVSFTEGIHFTFPNRELEPGGYVLVAKDLAVFASRYTAVPPGVDILGPYDGRLANGGEQIRLEDAIGQTIHDFEYGDGWRPITDGNGFSLTIIDPTNNDPNGDPNGWGEKNSWRASAYVGGSPGDDDSGILPNPGAIVINEVLSHSHLAPDWIELYNTTGAAIDISGWFLSDNDANLMKYRIPDMTTIGSNKYKVFYEDLHFGDGNNPGSYIPFAFSENGEAVCLSSAEGGVLTGYRAVEDFGASETGVSFGRYFKSSTGNYNFVSMDFNTPGGLNAPPKVGPIVISEIMYNPQSGNQNEEYIELYNITGSPITLYDYVEGEPWKFTDGINFTFPDSPNEVAIPAGGYLLVVKNQAAFALRYPSVPLPPDRILGPYGGQLRNGGERVEISKPGDVDIYGTRYYIRVDRVNYSDGWHPEDCPGGVDLWPKGADGGGKSLMRINLTSYGNDVINWGANDPSPGEESPGPPI